MDCKAVFTEALQAARTAVKASAHLENPTAFDCGFAWVVIKPARGPFVNWCKAQIEEVGGERTREARVFGHRREYGGGGWEFWMPGGDQHSGQSIAVFEAGARAFAEVLKRHGLDAEHASRLD